MNKRLPGILTLPLLTVPLAACGPANPANPANGGGAKARATVAASGADAQLMKDGYSPRHVPGFGKADIGIKAGVKISYELVYAGKDAELVKTAVDEAGKHPEPGVTYRAAGNLAIVDAASLGQLRDGLKTLVKSL